MANAYYLVLPVTICAIFSPAVFGLKDGEIYKFISVADGNVLSVNSTSSGYTLTSEPWQDSITQKWLAVEAIIASDSFLLISPKQTWPWNKFVQDSTKNRKEHLPDNTLVAAGVADGKDKGKIITESYNGKKSQQWKTVSLGHDKVLVKNLIDDKCIVNIGEVKKHGFLNKLKNTVKGGIPGKKSKGKKPGLLELQTCNPTDEKHTWRIEVLPSSAISTN